VIDNAPKTEMGILVSQKSNNQTSKTQNFAFWPPSNYFKQMGYLDSHRKCNLQEKEACNIPLEKRPWERRLERGLEVASFRWEERERLVVRDGFLGMQGRVKQWIAVVTIILFVSVPREILRSQFESNGIGFHYWALEESNPHCRKEGNKVLV